ncbi:hypothetical protein, partial [Moorena sp. SIO4A1]|uniref:hypothetical protein n=1 Tax=Moorena sp. SIO4A1 TaxID=2607835 RepID=UPI0025F8EC9A
VTPSAKMAEGVTTRLKAMQWPHGEAARSWGGSAVLGVPPTRALPWFPPLALCRGFPDSRFASRQGS